ncbi:dephospho-CoA kinase [Lutimonas halocynthiae]|uniref:dephospho-CoA kinase n=1 Tax=Lutimonas halocynthiae TaxID=1446477 RepID=UPI0025B48EEC|nr:dephospho-CoA kinase [Lutimonas halocynthiae]MDN3643656.1 dephospho-CoA kinase [Lutimonas halocynthiae]
MRIVGLTGGIGSGKSTVARMFERLGVPVYYSDVKAKHLMNTSDDIRKGLIDVFGPKSFENGELNRSYIASLVFNNEAKLKKLNSIVHPEVKRNFKKWISKQSASYVIEENPLIFENNSQHDFDLIITVTAPKKIRIQRVMERDGLSENEVLARVKNQLEDELKINGSDFVITNESLNATKTQVDRINEAIMAQIP